MGKVDDVLQASVDQINTPPEEKKVETSDSTKQPVLEAKEEQQLELIQEKPIEQEKKEKKKYKVQTYGKEKELEIGEDEIPEYVQKGHAATEKWKEANKIREEVLAKEKWIKDWEETIKKNPDVYFEQVFGKDKAKKFYEERVLRDYEMEKLPPEQREIYEYQSRVEALKKEEQELMSKSEARKAQEMEAYAMQRLQDMTTSSLKKVGIENPDGVTYRQYLDFIRPYLEHAENVTENEMDLLTKEFHKRSTEGRVKRFDTMTPEQLVAEIGKKNVEKIRSYLLSAAGKPQVEEVKKPKEEKKFNSIREYMDTL